MDTMKVRQENGRHPNYAINERKRILSLRVFYLTGAFTMMGTSVGVSSVWPYLYKIDPSLTPLYLGWVNAGMGIGTMVSDILLGKWMSTRNCKEPLIFSTVCMSVAGLLYFYAQSMETSGAVIVLIARTVYGISRGNLAICRAGIAEATTSKDRTIAMTNLGFYGGFGFSFGAVLQMILVLVGDGVYVEPLKMFLNLYTIPGLIAFVLGIFNLLAIILYFDHKGHRKEDNYAKKIIGTNYIAVASLLFIYSVVYFAIASLETFITPLAMDEYALTKEEAVFYIGIFLLVYGAIGMLQLQFAHKFMSKRFSDRKLIAGSLFVMVSSFLLFIPFGDKYPKLLIKDNTIQNLTRFGNNSLSIMSDVGCPAQYNWCTTTPQLALGQFVTASFLFPIGHASGVTAVIGLYSKFRGPRGQGSFMSIIAAFGDTARLAAPPLVAKSYVSVGPRWTSLWLVALVLSAILILFFTYKRLIPYEKQVENHYKEEEKWLQDQSNEEISYWYSPDILYITENWH